MSGAEAPAAPSAPHRSAGRRGIEVGTYFVLAFALTWAAWIPAGLSARDQLTLPVPDLALVILGGLGPMLAAIVLTAHRAGRRGVVALFRQLDPRGVQRRWFVAPLVMLPVSVSPVALHLATGGTSPTAAMWLQVLLVFPAQMVFVAVLGGGLDEEMGWRGYALPRLLRTGNPVLAHLLLGAVWACWHLPLWLDPAGPHAFYPFWLYLLITIGRSVIIGWLYAASGGSLTVAILAHAVANSGDGVRYQLLGPASGGLDVQVCLAVATTLVAVLLVVATRGRLGADRFREATGALPRPRAPRELEPPPGVAEHATMRTVDHGR